MPETKSAARAWLLRAHYHLMNDSRFWYEIGLRDASRILCVAASDLRIEIERGR